MSIFYKTRHTNFPILINIREKHFTYIFKFETIRMVITYSSVQSPDPSSSLVIIKDCTDFRFYLFTIYKFQRRDKLFVLQFFVTHPQAMYVFVVQIQLVVSLLV